ncbi:hypothetical protein GT347_17570 [Xylophilus rhododendri]|uniref:Uncharacterized protein n=1 Tax=Xylophilus rhododendri TaxID=2697032 RepID=A0A857JA55_9BURK|nr:hypothetical protein [Xylophilus rhododendri]QHI99625.1 hypothetical protein GT347_17570 [Xylophilus rhododendri]
MFDPFLWRLGREGSRPAGFSPEKCTVRQPVRAAAILFMLDARRFSHFLSNRERGSMKKESPSSKTFANKGVDRAPNLQQCFTHKDIDDLRQVLHHVSSLASAGIGITRDRSESCDSLDDLQQQLHIVQYLLDRIGWASDVGLRKLGESGVLNNAEDWMLWTS